MCSACRMGVAQPPSYVWTHAALWNPWKLMTWLEHKAMTETLRYVHVAEVHRRDLPAEILAAAQGELEPDRRVLKLPGARRLVQARQPDGNGGQNQGAGSA